MRVERLLAAVIIVGVAAPTRPVNGQEQPLSGSAAPDITPTEEAAGPWSWIKKPSVTMPKLTFPKMPAEPLAPVKNSAKKVSDGAKKAWEGTKELFTLGGSKDPQPQTRVASKESPSLWQRMFGEKKAEPEGPQSVTEWMKQPRPE
jgi:hypothetical protein